MIIYTLAGALALAAPAGSAAAEPAPVPIEALAEIPFLAEPVLSPDGKKLLAKINTAGREALAVYDLSAAPDTPPKWVPYQGSIRWFGWAGNDRVLIGETLFSFALDSFSFQFTHLSRWDSKTGESLDIGQGNGLLRDQVIFTDPAGRYVLLATQKTADVSPGVTRVDLANGAAVEIQKKKEGIGQWFADSGGTLRGGIAYSSGGWTIYARDAATGELRRAASGKMAGKESVIDSITLLPGLDTGIIVTNERTGRFGVYRYDLRAQAVGEPIFEHPEVDISSTRMSDDLTTVEGVYYENDRPEVAWLTPDRRKLQADLDKTFKGKVNRMVSESRDGNIVLVWSGGPDDPGNYYLFDRKARRMTRFATPYEKLAEQTLSPVEPIRYSARDGLSIRGYLTLPAGAAAKNLPLIVMPHGGPFARDSYGFDPFVQLLASRGYAVLQPNFRGSTGFGREFVERGYGQWGTGMQDDLDDGVAWLAGRGTIDPKRVCIVGASYGGYAALWGAIRNPDRYRCAVSLSGVTDLRAMLKYDSSALVARRYSKSWRTKVEGEEKRDLAAVSPLQQAGRLSVPVLIAHGNLDSNVPVDQSRKLVEALRKRGAPVQSVFYSSAGHGFSRSEDMLDYMKRLEAFLEVHNPSDRMHPKAPREPELAAGTIAPEEFSRIAGKKAQRDEIGLRYLVAADGRVTSCTVARPSGASALDKQACTLAEERFQYRPALAADGSRKEAWVEYTGTWKKK